MCDQVIKTSNRSIGILLHPSALPESPICGTFGSPARSWLKFLSANGIGVWQFLPLGPCDSTGSPYSSPSSFSLNPWFLDCSDLVLEGFLSESILDEIPEEINQGYSSIDFKLANLRSDYLAEALLKCWPKQSGYRHLQFKRWCKDQFWLDDHSCFVAIRREYSGLPWWKWPKGLAMRNPLSIRNWKRKNKNEILKHSLMQWLLFRQWESVKELAGQLNILLLGDMPFYVSRDSSDVWSSRKLFSILPSGNLQFQSGVPPDYFSNTGQLWGTPVYSWNIHKLNRFRWWRRRLSRHLKQVDLLRIDHFRAFEAFWSVPGNDLTAENGEWISSPGFQLLKYFSRDCKGTLPLIAEDLGIITPKVELLRDSFNLPGMKVLQFAFNGDTENPYLPSNIKGDKWVVYTGTHDNPTTLGWWNGLDNETKNRVNQLSDGSTDSPSWKLIKLALGTEAKFVIVPIQDLLSLDNSARFNKPGSIEDNWKWRLKDFDEKFIYALNNYRNKSISCSRIE